MCPHLCIAVKKKLFKLFNHSSVRAIVEFKLMQWIHQVVLIN